MLLFNKIYSIAVWILVQMTQIVKIMA